MNTSGKGQKYLNWNQIKINNNLIHVLTLHIGYVEISNQKYHKNGFASHVGSQMTTYSTTLFHAFGLCEDLHFHKEVKCGTQLLS